MTTYTEIKTKYQNDLDVIITKHKGFFAFSQEQLEEGMKRIGVADKTQLTQTQLGMIMPKEEVKGYYLDALQAQEEYKKALKKAKQEKENAILYELNNHESFYTGDIDDVIPIFKGIFSRKDIVKVFNKHKHNQSLIY